MRAQGMREDIFSSCLRARRQSVVEVESVEEVSEERRVEVGSRGSGGEVIIVEEGNDGVACGFVFVRAESVGRVEQQFSSSGVVVFMIARIIELRQRARSVDRVGVVRIEVASRSSVEVGSGVALQFEQESKACAVIGRQFAQSDGVIVRVGASHHDVGVVRHASIISEMSCEVKRGSIKSRAIFSLPRRYQVW